MSKAPILSYIIGFLLSIILTLASYIVVFIHVNSIHEIIPHEVLIPLIIGIGFLQLIVQVIFFLHLLQESRPRWNLVFFIGTMSGVLLIIIASIWIMNHLNRNMNYMSAQQMDMKIMKDEGIKK